MASACRRPTVAVPETRRADAERNVVRIQEAATGCGRRADRRSGRRRRRRAGSAAPRSTATSRPASRCSRRSARRG